MLILVMVTIRISKDGGLFTTTRKATRDTEEQSIYDQIVSAMELKDDGKIKPRDTFESFKNKFGSDKIAEKDGNTASKIVFTVKGARDTYTYTITENEIIIGEIEEQNDYDILKRYFLGADGNGRNLDDIIDFDTMTFKQDPLDETSKVYEKLKFAYAHISEDNEDAGEVFVKDNSRNVYKIGWEIQKGEVGEDGNVTYEVTMSRKESFEKVASPEGNLGKYVQYKGKKWIVLYDDDKRMELITAEMFGKVTLGYEDEKAIGESNYEKGIWSYNNAIETLKNKCQEVTGITVGIRNVGGPDEDVETLGEISLEKLKSKGFMPSDDAEDKIKELLKNLKDENDNYLEDYEQMKKLGIIIAEGVKEDDIEGYWFSSRLLDVDNYNVYFTLPSINNFSDELYKNNICYVNSRGDMNGSGGGSYNKYAVRPVVSLKPGILDGKTGNGTEDDPIILE